jgi:conjugal transfer pilus assembly protein TraK
MSRLRRVVLPLLSLLLMRPAGAAPAPAAAGAPTLEQVCAQPGPPRLTLQPGVNQVVAVARGHLNRLVAPFPARVKTTDESASVEVEGRVVYFATRGDLPVTLFLTPADSDHVALSVTLVPCSLAPRELQLTLAEGAGYLPAAPVATTAATGQPYVDALTQAFRELALQRVPAGYTLRAAGRGDLPPACALPGVTITPMQVLDGADLILLVARVENNAAVMVEISETACASDDVAAVAVWPALVLAPGETTELYLARRRPAEGAGAPRPSLRRR